MIDLVMLFHFVVIMIYFAWQLVTVVLVSKVTVLDYCHSVTAERSEKSGLLFVCHIPFGLEGPNTTLR